MQCQRAIWKKVKVLKLLSYAVREGSQAPGEDAGEVSNTNINIYITDRHQDVATREGQG